MITGVILRKIAAKGGRIHRLSWPASATTPAFACHYATKPQADRDLKEHMDNWPTVAVNIKYDSPLASDMDLTALVLP